MFNFDTALFQMESFLHILNFVHTRKNKHLKVIIPSKWIFILKIDRRLGNEISPAICLETVRFQSSMLRTEQIYCTVYSWGDMCTYCIVANVQVCVTHRSLNNQNILLFQLVDFESDEPLNKMQILICMLIVHSFSSNLVPDCRNTWVIEKVFN